MDQLIEHYNLYVPRAFHVHVHFTCIHVYTLYMYMYVQNLGVLFLFEAAKKTDRAFKSAPQSIAHSVRSAQDDISSMVGHMLASGITTVSANRNTSTCVDLGWQKLCTTSWLQDRLSASVQEEEGEVDVDH